MINFAKAVIALMPIIRWISAVFAIGILLFGVSGMVGKS